MHPCERCGSPTPERICEQCSAGRLVPDGGDRESADSKWNPAVNEDWDSQRREAYLERQSRPTAQSPADRERDDSDTEASEPQPDSEKPSGQDQPDDQQDNTSGADLLSRRNLLLGGAGAVLVASGGRRVLSSGLDGAKGVAEKYVLAVADNDWEAAGELYHEDSRIRQDIDQRGSIESYEDVLDERGSLQFLSEIEPEIKGIHEWRDVPDPDAERPDARFVPSGASELDGYKQIIAIVRLDAVALYRARGMDDMLEQIEGERTNEVFQIGTVKDLTEWSIWRVSYPA